MSTNENPTPNDMPQHVTEPGRPAEREPSTMDSWPDEARAAVEALRKENGKYRTRAKLAADDEWYKRATDALSELDRVEQSRKSAEQRLTEERDAAASRASEAETSVQRLRAALGAGFAGTDADDIAQRLRGTTPEEYAADAQALRERFGPSTSDDGMRPDPSQGAAAGAHMPLNGDPLADALRRKLK